MAVEFRTLTMSSCPYCGCTTVVKEEIGLRGSGDFDENDKGRKEHRWFKCGCHVYTCYEHSMPENIWQWTEKAEGRCGKIIKAKDQLMDFMKNQPRFPKEVYLAVCGALNNIDISKVDTRDF